LPTNISDSFDVPGVEFYDVASGRTMKYVYPDTKHWAAGWILYRNGDGGWVTLRKASPDDVSVITRAVVRAHHTEEAE
jgi:hypothetical protein